MFLILTTFSCLQQCALCAWRAAAATLCVHAASTAVYSLGAGCNKMLHCIVSAIPLHAAVLTQLCTSERERWRIWLVWGVVFACTCKRHQLYLSLACESVLPY